MIPETAVEAAARAIDASKAEGCGCCAYVESTTEDDNRADELGINVRALLIARESLEAAAPHMHAVILDDAAEPSGGGKAMEMQISAPTRITEQNELALVIAAAEGLERQDLTTDALEDYLQTAAEVLAAGFGKVTK